MNERVGELLLCPTPIGNLEDVTLRVLRTLKEVDMIAAEDTRTARKLLNHYGIQNRLTSYHKDNERQKSQIILGQLLEGKKVALVSEAGMPGISDPGAKLVKMALDAGVKVTVLPGPSAILVALVGSGLPTDRFAFEGFLPRRKKARRDRLLGLVDEARTMVFYETPHRVIDTVLDLLEILGDRPAAMARELTKMHEEVIRGTLSHLLARMKEQPPKGEICLVVSGNPRSAGQEPDVLSHDDAVDMVLKKVGAGMKLTEASKLVSKQVGMKRSDLYRMVLDSQKEQGQKD